MYVSANVIYFHFYYFLSYFLRPSWDHTLQTQYAHILILIKKSFLYQVLP